MDGVDQREGSSISLTLNADSPARRSERIRSITIKDITQKQTADLKKKGKPTNAHVLNKKERGEDQRSIQDFVDTALSKNNKVITNTTMSVHRSPVQSTLTTKVGAEQSKDRNRTPPTNKVDGMSSESLTILKRIDKLSKQISESKKEHSTEINDLKVSIESRLDEQDLRLEAVEQKVEVLSEGMEKEKILERVEALQKFKESGEKGLAGTNTHIVEWLSKVAERLEQRERSEKAHNLLISGLETTGSNPMDAVADFLSKYFKIENVKKEIEMVSIFGKEKPPRLRIIPKNLATKYKILNAKSSSLKGTNFFIEQDLTPLESEIRWKGREVARAEKAKGNASKAVQGSVLIDKVWHVWDQTESL